MNTSNIDPVIEDIHGRFKTAGIEVDRNKIRSNLDRLTGYKVPLFEASRTVIPYFARSIMFLSKHSNPVVQDWFPYLQSKRITNG